MSAAPLGSNACSFVFHPDREGSLRYIRCCRFHRLVPLPEGVKGEAVKASFKEGVLKITVPLPTVATTMTHVVAVDGEPKKKSVTVAA